MANPLLLARAAAVLTDEDTRKTVGWIVVAVLSPIILVIAFLCALAVADSTEQIRPSSVRTASVLPSGRTGGTLSPRSSATDRTP